MYNSSRARALGAAERWDSGFFEGGIASFSERPEPEPSHFSEFVLSVRGMRPLFSAAKKTLRCGPNRGELDLRRQLKRLPESR